MPKLAAFDQGQTPTIAFVNAASEPLGFDLNALVAALRIYLNRDFVPIWSTPANLVVNPGKTIPPGQWAIVFLDDADTAGALGYHDLTTDGFPLSKVFVRTAKRAHESLSVTASHELTEMLVDPAANLASIGPNNVFFAYETADAVENEYYIINGFQVSNFVYPSWFEGFRRGGKFDHLGHCKRPFQILKGGYMPVFSRGRWSQIFGSEETKKQFHLKDHPRAMLRRNSEKKKSKK